MVRSTATATVAALFVAAFASDATATELRYRWKQGATHRFQTTGTDVVSISGMGMNIDAEFHTRSRFALVIEQVAPDGLARGKLVIESFEVKDDSGQLLAGLESIPKGALSNPVRIDAKGRFQFEEVIYLMVEEGGESHLVTAKVGPTGGSASAQAGDEKVTVFASFDPKTGRLSGGAKIEKVAAEKKKKTVAVKQDAKKVDLLPRQFMELLRLPDGPVTAGGAFDVEVGPMRVSVKVEELTPEVAKLKTTVGTQVAVAAPAEEEHDDGELGAGAGGMGMPDLSKMGMGNLPGMGGGGGKKGQAGAMGMKSDGAFTATFDRKAGMLERIAGKLTTETDAAGMMKIRTTSDLEMTAVR